MVRKLRIEDTGNSAVTQVKAQRNKWDNYVHRRHSTGFQEQKNVSVLQEGDGRTRTVEITLRPAPAAVPSYEI